MNALVQRFRTLPRAARWAVFAGAILVAYFAVVEPVIDRINTTASRADDRESALVALAKDPIGAQSSEVALGVRKFGAVELPGDPEVRSVAFNRRVVEVLSKHRIRNDTSTTRTMPLGAGPLKSAYTEEERIDRLVREVQFSATPEELAAVIADLESSPEVAAVSRVQLRRGDNQDTAARQLKVTLAVETWVVNRRGGRAR